ncbi:MAG: peroxiredoxin [Polyangiaceae bacterium]
MSQGWFRSVVLATSLLGCFGCSKASTSATASGSASSSAPTTTAPVDALVVGADAPKVTLTLQDGKKIEVGGPSERLVLVYFYPKDDTPGCTIEAKGIRDAWDRFKAAGIDVYGVSTQDAQSHQAFIDKFDLPFPLAVDKSGEIASAFKVPLKEGRATRQSFLIGKDGKLKAVWLAVKPDEHAEDVLKAASS